MCDLWQYTTTADTPAGAVPSQIAAARAALRNEPAPVTAMKLYNAGSFFDPRAVPEDDFPAVAESVAGLDRVVVESHPALVGRGVDRFLKALDAAAIGRTPPALEVAIGLETAHPQALDLLNKRFTITDFARSADTLRARGVTLRVFLLIRPPFVAASEQDDWLLRSVDTAFDCGAAVVSLVPTRAGNGTVEALASRGLFAAPTLDTIEHSLRLALGHARGRGLVFADLWDLDRFSPSGKCSPDVRSRLNDMNLRQRIVS
jgi:radical SAM enzyme (TIGR01210 family)